MERRQERGFGLVELLVALALGLLLSGLVVQALVGEGRNARRFARVVREGMLQRRALALVRSDLERARAVPLAPQPLPAACGGQAGRRLVLQMETAEGMVSWLVGPAPSGIWRGRVLVRCGPAYGLDGGVNAGAAFQSRVVLDGLAERPQGWAGCGGLAGAVELNGSGALPFSACVEASTEVVALRLEQLFEGDGGPPQRIRKELVAGAG